MSAGEVPDPVPVDGPEAVAVRPDTSRDLPDTSRELPDTWRDLVAAAGRDLTAAGIATPGVDAELLAAHAAGFGRARLRSLLLAGQRPEPAVAAVLAALVERRAACTPLQHLTGRAPFRYLELAVGPGCFIPRPETELLAGWAVGAARATVLARGSATVVDLGTGSGAIAAAVASEVPHAGVLAVEIDPDAHRWATRNLDPLGVEVLLADGALLPALRPELAGAVDVVVTNPPYIPLGAWESVTAEVRDHDPARALWGGPDGLDVVRALVRSALALLRPGGVLGIEHAEAQAASLPALLAATGRLVEIRDHDDLTGRSRYTTARLPDEPARNLGVATAVSG